MKKSTLRLFCLFLNFIMIMPFAVLLLAAIQSGANPFYSVLFFFLLTLSLANFFHIYYKKKTSFLLKSINFIAAFFSGILIIGSVGNTDVQDSMKLLVLTFFLIFNINYVYTSGKKIFGLIVMNNLLEN